MARNQERNFGSDWRRENSEMDMNRGRSDRREDFDRNSDRFPESFEQRNYQDRRDSGRNMGAQFDDHHRGFTGDRDYNRDYDLGTGTSMRMNRYESNRSEDRGGFYGKGPKGWRRSDDRIKDEICESLYENSMIDASEIEVSVKEGHVTLSGSVESRASKREAERLIDHVRGVEDVQNNLRVMANQNITDIGTSNRKASGLS